VSCVDCIELSYSMKTLAQDIVQLAGCCEHGNELSGSIWGGGDLLTCWASVNFWRRSLLQGVS